MWPDETEVSAWQQVKLSDVSLGARMEDSLVADGDVMKPINKRKFREFLPLGRN